MAKSNPIYFCKNCGHESQGWLGRCPACMAWNTMIEEPRASRAAEGKKAAAPAKLPMAWVADADAARSRQAEAGGAAAAVPFAQRSDFSDKSVSLNEFNAEKLARLATGVTEFDRVLGGGFVPGSLTLLAGDPGIGKSTLLLQLAGASDFASSVLYVAGEESAEQIKARALRLKVNSKGIRLLSEINFEAIADSLAQLRPTFCIVDSIQTIYSDALESAPGSVAQVRDVAAGFLRLAKALGITIVLVGHVTKDGGIAGPRVLEHIVDTVLYFEGEKHASLRMLRSVKNRFGATHELGLFEMTQHGLIGIENAAGLLLAERPENVPGTAISSILEGSRALLVELQALTTEAPYGQPARNVQAYDRGRLNMILAVLEKKLGLISSNKDVFVNVVGGIKISETGTDLALAMALVSSLKNKPLPPDTLFLGEIGLTGELRSVSAWEKRVSEAWRLGFKRCILPPSKARDKQKLPKGSDIDLVFVDKLSEALDVCWGREE